MWNKYLLFSPTVPGSRPAIGAMAYSLDQNGAQYGFQAAPSLDGVLITGLAEMTKQALKRYHSAMTEKKRLRPNIDPQPKVIFVYRTGISDAEKGKISSMECNMIMQACASMPGDYKWV